MTTTLVLILAALLLFTVISSVDSASTWTLSVSQAAPALRAQHAALTIFDKAVLVWGGESVNLSTFNVDSEQPPSLAIFDGGTSAFMGFTETGSAPQRRIGSSLVEVVSPASHERVVALVHGSNHHSNLNDTSEANVQTMHITDNLDGTYNVRWMPTVQVDNSTESSSTDTSSSETQWSSVRDMSVVKVGKTVLAYGGFDSDPTVPYKDDLLELTVMLHNQSESNPSATYSWNPVSTVRDTISGERPSARAGHSLDVILVTDLLSSDGGGVSVELVLFGGMQYNHAEAGPTQAKVRYFGDLWTLTVKLLEADNGDSGGGKLSTLVSPAWTRRDAGWDATGSSSVTRPPARTSHCSVVYGGKLYVFGGYRVVETNQRVIEVLDDLWELDPSTGYTWRQVSEVGGVKPVARAFHSLSWVPAQSKAFSIGGVVYTNADDGDLLPNQDQQVHALALT